MVKQILEKIDKDKLLHFVAGSLIYASTSWLLGYYALGLVVVVADTVQTSNSARLGSVPVYANNDAALAGGLIVGDLYRTGANPDPLCIVH